MKEIIPKLTLSKLIKISIVFGLLIISLSVFYYLVVWPYQNEKGLERCFLEAKEKCDEQWIATCHSLFSEQLIQKYSDEELCNSLPAEYADGLIENYQKAKDNCFRQYQP